MNQRQHIIENWEMVADRFPELAGDEVHIWIIHLSLPEGMVVKSEQVLSEVEKERGARFFFDRHRKRFIAAHSAKRHILSGYVGRAENTLEFSIGAQGKPHLISEKYDPCIRFNLSHSGEYALVAVTPGQEVGVDIERVDSGRASTRIARRFFAPEEVADFNRLSDDQRVEGFFNAWTRKEAYMKAVGKGLSLGLSNFVVSLRPGDPARLLQTKWYTSDLNRWVMFSFTPRAGYAAAAVVEKSVRKMRVFEYQPNG